MNLANVIISPTYLTYSWKFRWKERLSYHKLKLALLLILYHADMELKRFLR